MRLIDADALKKEVNKKNVVGRFNTLLLIDNAPTVTLSLNLDNMTEEDIEKFKMIWQRATSKGLITVNVENCDDCPYCPKS